MSIQQRFTRRPFLVVLAFTLCSCCGSVLPAAKTYWEPATGDVGDWFNVDNWRNGVPNANDVADFVYGGSAHISSGIAQAFDIDLVVGGSNDDCNLIISNGGKLTSSFAKLDSEFLNSSSSATITGPESKWTNTYSFGTTFTVGHEGVATITIDSIAACPDFWNGRGIG